VTDELLVFSGVKWTKVRITGTGQMSRKFVDDRGRGAKSQLFYDLAPAGTGRRYQARGAAGWWRDLAVMDTNDREQVLAFLARRGDPAGRLEQAALNAARQRLGQPLGEDPRPSTGEWFNLIVTVKTIAKAWSPPGKDGVSIIDDPARWNDAKAMWNDPAGFGAGWLGELERVPDPEERRPLILRPKTLAAYMAVSAAFSLFRRAQMRTCARCGSWFEFTKAHARYCCVSCRTLAHDSRRV
jgi:hypothetical protein